MNDLTIEQIRANHKIEEARQRRLDKIKLPRFLGEPQPGQCRLPQPRETMHRCYKHPKTGQWVCGNCGVIVGAPVSNEVF